METYDVIFNDEEIKELRRNVETLLSTREGTQPVDRNFGINWDCLDQRPEIAESIFLQEIIQKIDKYIPRIEVQEVRYEIHEGGRLFPRIILQQRKKVR